MEKGWIAWLTGMSGVGKTTIAERTAQILEIHGAGRVEIVDGDALRAELGGRLGFDRSSRDLNVAVAGLVARVLARRGCPVIVSLISPFDAARSEQRALSLKEDIPHVIAHVRTTLDVLRQRDTKGLYRDLAAGTIQNLSGVDQSYEPPEFPDVAITTTSEQPAESAWHLVRALVRHHLVIEDAHDFAI